MASRDAQDAVARSWTEVMDEYYVPRDDKRQHALAQLDAAYSEPHRHYHNLDHLAYMFDELALREREARDFNVLRIATFYHDIVYDPRNSENERRSADLARCTLTELGLNQETIKRVCELILLTRKHEALDDDFDASLFLGVDLAILASPTEMYESYSKAIRLEYNWVPERDYYLGRKKVMKDFTARSKIYQSKLLYHWESRARANITAEIAQIDETLKTLPS